MSPQLVRVLHRARNVDAARKFYAAVLGEPQIEIVPLPAAAVARGVPAHWLGVICVEDVPKTLAAFVARGATAWGPIEHDARGMHAIVRDPGGALIQLSTAASAPAGPDLAWSHLDARDAAGTFGAYAELFGWQATEPIDLGAAGVMMQFAWAADGRNVGSYADLATRPNIHPQWLFHFRVRSLDDAVIAVRSGGGVVLADVTNARGTRRIMCDDPQTGGFALCDASDR